MNIVLQRTSDHTTSRGLTGYYLIARDAVTCQRVAMLQVVTLKDGSTEFRDTDKQPMPAGICLNEALRLAMAHEQKRRAPRSSRPQPSRRHNARRPKPERWHVPPPPVRPMRRLLVGKLAARHGKVA